MKTPYPHNHHLSSPFPKLFPPCCTKIKWHFHYMSIPHTFIRYLWGRILSSQTSISHATEKDKEDEQVPGMGQAERSHRRRSTLRTWRRDCRVPSLMLQPEVILPPPGPWDTVLHSVQGLMALLDCSFSSGPRLKQLHLSPQHLSDYLAHRCSNHVYWTKEGNWFLFHLFIIIPIFMWKWHNPFEVPSSQKKSPSLPLTRTTFLWVPWWETFIFLYLSIINHFSKSVSFQLWFIQKHTSIPV